jgi:uncharacterized protein (DUF934 family)
MRRGKRQPVRLLNPLNWTHNTMTLQIISATDHTDIAQALTVANDADANSIAFDNLQRIDLHFPKFTDGRAFSQAFVLRRRGFKGDIRAHGDVLIDQLLQMQRSGFSSAVLRADQDAAHGQKLLNHYKGFYQGDAVHAAPHFKHAA